MSNTIKSAVYYLYGAHEEAIRIVESIPTPLVVRVVDDDPAKGYPGIDSVPRGAPVVNAICSSTAARARAAQRIFAQGARLKNAWPRSVEIHGEIGDGFYAQDFVVVQYTARIEPNCAANAGALVMHDCRIGYCCFIGPAANLCGGVTLGSGVYVGASAVILPGVTVGADATIGAGSVVTKDVPAGATVKGNPAK